MEVNINALNPLETMRSLMLRNMNGGRKLDSMGKEYFRVFKQLGIAGC